MTALLSVTDKRGLVDLATALKRHSHNLVATGGTATQISAAGIDVIEAGAFSGVGEMMGGRVKTLSPKIFAGILSRRNAEDDADLLGVGSSAIDIVVCNLYRFDSSAADPVAGIDIGGVALIRAAAKNCEHVSVIVDPDDYGELIESLSASVSRDDAVDRRKRWAAKAWSYIAAYDSAIATAYASTEDSLNVGFIRHKTLRYGENPHQSAVWWKSAGPGLHEAQIVEGKELSYNNVLDIAAAAALTADLGAGSAAIIKHQNACGAALRSTAALSLAAALETDVEAAFGGIISINGPIDEEIVSAIKHLFYEVIIGTVVTDKARTMLARRKNLRVVEWPKPAFGNFEYLTIPGGILTQTRDTLFHLPGQSAWQVVSQRQPTADESRDMVIANVIVKHVRSNAIVLVKNGATVGIGAGQMSRADSVGLAISKAGDRANGSVMASDAFFPFSDGLENAPGITAVIQPGGSMRDSDVIAAADRLGMALCFTGVRHFKH